MWTRKGLKKKAQATMKQNFWRMVSVCFLIAMLTTAYPLSTAFLNTHIPALSPDSSASTTPVIEETASGILNESITYFFIIQNCHVLPKVPLQNILIFY